MASNLEFKVSEIKQRHEYEYSHISNIKGKVFLNQNVKRWLEVFFYS